MTIIRWQPIWNWLTGQSTADDHVNVTELTVAAPSRLREIEQRQAADAEAKILRVSGKVGAPKARVPAIEERRR